MSQLKRFFSPQLAEMIVAGDVENPLKTHRREVTVAFLDLRGFTAFADASEPEEVISFLRDYHRDMGQLIHEHGGTLEQFAGDSLMVIFNDPIVIDDPAACAIRMAVAMRERFVQTMVPWKKRGHDIGLGIGIAHGYATIGQIGFEDRIGYGVIGRVTNLAARLCSEAKEGQILVSQPVFALVEDLVDIQECFSANDLKYRTAKNIPTVVSSTFAAVRTVLLHDPGERWTYGVNIDWLGRIVEQQRGKRLGEVMKERVFEPLGIKDIGFTMTESMKARRVTFHDRAQDGKLTPLPDLVFRNRRRWTWAATACTPPSASTSSSFA